MQVQTITSKPEQRLTVTVEAGSRVENGKGSEIVDGTWPDAASEVRGVNK